MSNQIRPFTNISLLASYAHTRADVGIYNGLPTPSNVALVKLCSHLWHPNPKLFVLLIFTREIGAGIGKWWRNPHSQHCYHLSVAFFDAKQKPLWHDLKMSREIALQFFGTQAPLTFVETQEHQGHAVGTWHYRLFCDAAWKPKAMPDLFWLPFNWQMFNEPKVLS